VDRAGGTSPDNPGGPYAGEYNATIGALQLAGLPAGNIVPIVDSADATAHLAELDVLLFMEQESCAATAAPWVAVLTSFVAAGGRVVATTSLGNTGSFINGLGLFGTGAVEAVAQPYTPVSDPFWDGIVHPGYLNATYGWRWSGAGLHPLATSSDPAVLTVWGYDVP
jgi:hypothetical protein